jgi:hypothetical protein
MAAILNLPIGLRVSSGIKMERASTSQRAGTN